jgi:hypothetical protein
VKNVQPSKSELFKLPFRLPIPRNPDFVGRKNLLTQIHSHIFPPLGGHDQITAIDGRVAVLYGLGGMGKTQLALRYAAENRDQFSAIHYVDGSSEINARVGFRDIGQRYADMVMGLEDPEEPKRALQRLQLAPYFSPKGQLSYDNIHLIEITKAVTGILEQDGNDSWLLILDNVDELDKFPIRDFLPKTPFRRVIITTRLTAAIRLGYDIEVDSIDEVDGVAILLNSARLRIQDISGN